MLQGRPRPQMEVGISRLGNSKLFSQAAQEDDTRCMAVVVPMALVIEIKTPRFVDH
jgi:hypothetical protein